MTTAGRPIAIDPTELQAHIDELGQIGNDPSTGLYRPVYGPAWAAAAATVEGWFREAGLHTRRDAMGNVFGRVEGGVPEVILTGSHIDSVRQGGRYDGALGIHAGLAAIRGLVEAYGPPRRTLEVIALCEEEGSRFAGQFWGTRGILGMIDPTEPTSILDSGSMAIGDAMRAVGLDPNSISTATRSDLTAFVELHIEQGPQLNMSGDDIGVPYTITGLRQMRIAVTGRQDHAGTTPMEVRIDPLVAASEMVVAINSIARGLGPPAVATVGFLEVIPGAVNIVPREVRFTVDVRHPDLEVHRQLIDSIMNNIAEIARKADVSIDCDQLLDQPPVPLDPSLRAIIREAAAAEGARVRELASGAGHDSMMFAKRIPTAMIFVPSHGGRSHAPEEWTPIEQVVMGVRVLAGVLYRLAYQS